LKPLFSGPAFPGTIVESAKAMSVSPLIKLAAARWPVLLESEVLSSVQTQIVSAARGCADVILLNKGTRDLTWTDL